MRHLDEILSKKKRPKKQEYLYILSCGDLLKIGVTNNIEERIKTLQTGNPQQIILEHIEQRNEAYKIETYLHQQFQSFHVRGEWYKGLTVRDIRSKILMAHDYD